MGLLPRCRSVCRKTLWGAGIWTPGLPYSRPADTNWAILYPSGLLCTHWATLQPSELRLSCCLSYAAPCLIYAAPLLSYAAPYWAILQCILLSCGLANVFNSTNHKKGWVRKSQICKVPHLRKVNKSNKLFKPVNLRTSNLRNLFADRPPTNEACGRGDCHLIGWLLLYRPVAYICSICPLDIYKSF
jgi:hypothetical protein